MATPPPRCRRRKRRCRLPRRRRRAPTPQSDVPCPSIVRCPRRRSTANRLQGATCTRRSAPSGEPSPPAGQLATHAPAGPSGTDARRVRVARRPRRLISQMGHPDRSCALLAELLVVAATTTCRPRVLQAILPGLRRCAHRSSRRPAGARPWNSPTRSPPTPSPTPGKPSTPTPASTTPARPVLIDAVEARLRADQRGWLATPPTHRPPRRTRRAINRPQTVRAVRRTSRRDDHGRRPRGIIDRTQAVMLYSRRGIGLPHQPSSRHAASTLRRLSDPDPSASRLTSPAPTDTSRRLERSATPGRRRRDDHSLRSRPAVSAKRPTAVAIRCCSTPEAAALLGISDPNSTTCSKPVPPLRHHHAARRIPYADLAAYVEGLRHPTTSTRSSNQPSHADRTDHPDKASQQPEAIPTKQASTAAVALRRSHCERAAVTAPRDRLPTPLSSTPTARHTTRRHQRAAQTTSNRSDLASRPRPRR